ncbi:TonB-dependent receptor plug domain-containing protein [Glaciecola siphonariae]|uniref:TonB-dependent receptor plug domain-containing protein n=1 Tax=Glaciecola siphonariae TaxID=521012 RepID=A0ABV9LW10_9ALTE
MKHTLLFLALGYSVSGQALAAQTPQAPSQSVASFDDELETISITGSRSPIAQKYVAGALSVIDQAQIEASGALDLSELLRTIPSVNISQSGPMGTLREIRFRGSESNHVLVMLDGVEINDLGQGGLIDLSHLTLANISRIEVLRGPQSALWGSAAVAGIISITSKTASDSFSANLAAGYGNKNTAQVRGAVSGRDDNFSYSLSLAHLNTDGENIARPSVASGDGEDDGYKNTTAYAKLAYRFSKHNRIDANARLVDYKSDFDSTDFSTGLIADANNVSNGEQHSFGVNWYFSLPKSIWSQQLSYQYSDQENKNFSDAVFSGSTKGEKHRLVYNHTFDIESGHVNVGIDAVDEQYTQAGPVTFGDPNQQQDNKTLSFIADTHQRLGAGLSISASYRADNNDEFDNAYSYRVGLSFQASDTIKTFISYGKAVKNPSFTERFGFFPGTFLGNEALEPESSRSFELGIDTSIADVDVQASWYRAKLQDEILGFVFDADSGLFTAQNATEDSEREGIEIELSRALKQWRWSLSYAYLDASEANAVELRRARHSGSAWLSYDLHTKHSVYVQADYTGTRFDRFFPPFPAPSEVLSLDNYWLLSANYRYNYSEQISASVRISNALDEQFEDVIGFSGQSRRIFASLNYRW